MQLPRSPADAVVLSTLLFPTLGAALGGFKCDHILPDDKSFDLSALGGPRSVLHHYGNHNTTFTIDICKPLGKVAQLPTNEQCPHGTQVCAIKRLVTDGSDVFEEAIPIAGDLTAEGGKDMNARWEILRNSGSHADADREGLRVEMAGGFQKTEHGMRDQKAIVEFICDKTRDGLENLYDPEDKYTDGEDQSAKREENKAEEGNDDSNSSSLQYLNYDQEGDYHVLRLSWRTKYACKDAQNDGNSGNNPTSHWGFFTWFIIIAFLMTATYLIFGSWLNYNRNGARGWDLLPHGDTIRDVPYLLKDWTRRVLNTIQGGGSRGGYAAV